MRCCTEPESKARLAGRGCGRIAGGARALAVVLALVPPRVEAIRFVPSAAANPPPRLALAAIGGVATGSVAVARAETTNAPPPRWFYDLRPALLDAAVNYRPVFLLFTRSDCPWCVRLKSDVLAHPDVESLLRSFTRVEVDVEHHPELGQQHGLRGVPAIRILSSDGAPRVGVDGYASRRDVMDVLGSVLGVAVADRGADRVREIASLLESGSIPSETWPVVMAAMGQPAVRKAARERVLALAGTNRTQVVRLLGHPRLAVRLGTLDTLEELAGETFGFDPWIGGSGGEANAAALARWQAWANHSATGMTAFAALSRESFETYVNEVLTADTPERPARAIRMLVQGGPSAADELSAFLARRPDLPAGARRRLQEVRYAILLPPVNGLEPALVAHRLIGGNLDTRLRAIRELPRAGRKALTVLEDLLADADPLVREAAIEAALKAGRDAAVPMVEKHLDREKDRDVLFATLRGLRAAKTTRGLALLARYLRHHDEDLCIAAFSALAGIESKKASEDIRAGLRDARWRVRVAALECVSNIKPPGVDDLVEALLQDPDEFVRYTAVKTLAEVQERKAIPSLRAAFLRDDALKGPALSALCRLEAPVPAEFVAAVDGKPVETLRAVLGALRGCGKRGLPLVARLARHADDDVACGALSLLAAGEEADRSHETILAEALESGRRDRILSVLTSLRKDRHGGRYRDDESAEEDEDPAGEATDASRPAEPVGPDHAVKSVFDAFMGVGAKAPTNTATNAVAPAPGTGAPPPTREAGGPPAVRAPVEDVLDAFMGAQTASATGGASGAKGGDAGTPLRDVVRARLKDADPDVRFQAACALLRLKDASAIKEVVAGVAERPADQRLAVAESLRALATSRAALPAIGALLADPSEDVRRAAAEMLLSPAASNRLDVLFEELLRPGSRLRPVEIPLTESLSRSKTPSTLGGVRRWAGRMMATGGPAWHTTMAVLLLEFAWERGDTAKLEPLFKSADPYVRRAAWIALGRHDVPAFVQRAAEAAGDSSELVREVAAVLLGANDRQADLMHYFAEDALVEVSPWHFRSSRGSRPSRNIPVEKARDTLTRLANDASPKVRFEALLSLRLHGETVDPATLVRAIGSFADMERPAYRLSAAIGDGELLSDDEIRAYLPVLERAERRYSSLGKLRARIREDEADESASISYRPRHEPRAEAASNVVARARSGAATVRLAYFWRAGCRECEVASRVLDQVRRVFPHLIVEAYDMGQMSAMRLNEALCRRFEVPEEDRLVAPAMFTTAGFLIRDRIAFTRLGDLVERSAGLPEADWAAIPKAALDEAGTAIETRFEAMTFAVVMGNGLLDGVNPCAFATIVFLLSYLQVAKRTRRQILAVGAAFVVAVFATYYALGFGFAEAIKRSLLIQRAGHALDVAMAAVLALLVVLNARDGVLCLGGRMSEMSLQLPGVLKSAIHAAIRRQVRQSHMVLAASIAGVVVSLLELACTGQVYAPTVMYVLRQDPSAAKAHVLLFCYNLAFVVPLVVVFALAFGGVTSARMSGWLRRHAAAVKFATAGLFAVMLVLILLR